MFFLIRIFQGIISLILYLVSILLLAILSLLFYAISCILPKKSMRQKIRLFYMKHFPIWFMVFNFWIAQISTRKKWEILGTGELNPDNFYLMISNHQSWIDILVLCVAFKGKISPLKFFMKKELLWQLPLAGIACSVLGYPFMSRHTHAEIRKNPSLKGKDIETTKSACKKLKQLSPITLINFLEGTRFSEKKRLQQQSPFNYLLKPRAGGVAIVLNEMSDILSGVISVAIHYSGKAPSLWDFASGKIQKINVHYELINITKDLLGDYENDRAYRTHLQQWLNAIWQGNDKLLLKSKNTVFPIL